MTPSLSRYVASIVTHADGRLAMAIGHRTSDGLPVLDVVTERRIPSHKACEDAMFNGLKEECRLAYRGLTAAGIETTTDHLSRSDDHRAPKTIAIATVMNLCLATEDSEP
jgi:hypothetical protein